MKKKIFKIFLSSIAGIIALALAIQLFYLPRYLTKDVTVHPSESDSEELTIMNTNLRCDSPTDLFKKSWFYRAELIAADIDSVRPDIIGFQEASFIHYNYLVDIMDGYESVMAYRDNYVLSEGCPIFYRTDRFELIESGSFWLSETPLVMSKDWDSAHYRICIFVKLKDLNTGKEFAVFNTHLDHVSDEARINGIAVVLDKIAELGDIPSYLIGDMNAKENSKTIRAAMKSFDDAQKISPITEDTATFHGWGDESRSKRIDYILISKSDASVSEYHVLDNLHNGAYSSDHSSIYIKTVIN